MIYVSGSGKGVDGVKGTLVWHFFFMFLGGDELFLIFFFLKKNRGSSSHSFATFSSLLEKGIFWKLFLDLVLELCYGPFLFWTFSVLVDT